MVTTIKNNAPAQFTAKDIKALTGLGYRRLNVWERLGTVPGSPERGENWRRFTFEQVLAIAVCAELRQQLELPVQKLAWLQTRLAKHSKIRREVCSHEPSLWLATDLDSFADLGNRLQMAELTTRKKASGPILLVDLNAIIHKVAAYEPQRRQRSKTGKKP